MEGEPEFSEDPRSELIEKLLEYKKYKKAAALLEQQEDYVRQIFTKPQEDLGLYMKDPDYSLNLDLTQFVKAFNLFLQKQKKMEDIRKRYAVAERQQMTMETRVEQLRNLLFGKKKLKFPDLLDQGTNRYQVVLTFLSMLELIRQKHVKVQQNVNFGEITIIPHDSKEEPIAAESFLEEEPEDDQ